jgi:hypothetical protein
MGNAVGEDTFLSAATAISNAPPLRVEKLVKRFGSVTAVDGLLTFNAWAIDGFTKVFWRDEPIVNLWPQVSVLLAVGIVLFLIARRIARRWEFA